MEINPRQLTFAREYRGYSQTKLASEIPGLAQSNLSKFEKGIGYLSDEVLEKIIAFLDFPRGFFNRKIHIDAENAHFRLKAGIEKSEKMRIEYGYKLIGLIIDGLAGSVEFPKFALKFIDIEEGFTPESIAKYTRTALGLKDGPVMNINSLLERNGVVIVEFDADNDAFDGLSFMTDQGYLVIVLNKGFSNDRKRRTIAHELGHLIMHTCPTFIFPEHRNRKIRDKEADQFASEFLMPKDEIKNSLRNLKVSDLITLKRYWLTSMASLARRAYELECIDSVRYKFFNIELSRQRKREVIDVDIDEPKVFSLAYKMHKLDLNYSIQDMVNAFDVPMDALKLYCESINPNSKLRVVV